MGKYLVSLTVFAVVFSLNISASAKEELTLAEIEKISTQIPELKDPLQRLLKNDSSLIELTLSFDKIGNQGVEALAKTLKTNNTLTQLNLRGSFFGGTGSQGVQALAKVLASNSALTKLDLCINKIGDQGAEAIGKALATNSALTQLNLGGNGIGDQGAAAISKALVSNSTLKLLYLVLNQIGDQGAESFAKALQSNSSLNLLSLNGNQIGDQGAQAIAKALQTNSSLNLLSLNDNQIGDQGAQAIAKALQSNFSLKELSLYNPSLKGLGLSSSNQIGENLVNQINDLLACNKELAKVSFNIPALKNPLQRLLKNDPTLTELTLSAGLFDHIGDEGAQAVAKALETNSVLTKLTLAYIQIKYQGAQAIAKALATNSTLTNLILGSNQIGDQGAQAIAKALEINTSLKELVLSSNQIGDQGAQAIAKALEINTSLTRVDLDDNQIEAQGAEALFKALESNSFLTELNVNPNLWSDESEDESVDQIDNLLTPNQELARNKPEPADQRKALDQPIVILPSVHLVPFFAEQNVLTTSPNVARSQPSSLSNIPNNNNVIFDLNALANTKEELTPAEIEKISTQIPELKVPLQHLVKNDPTLTELDLRWNQIGYEGGRMIAKALEKNSFLTQLDLGYNELGTQGTQVIAKALERNSFLTQLGLNDNKIGNQGAQALAIALLSNTCLTALHLYDNPISNNLASQINNLLTRNKERANPKSQPVDQPKSLSQPQVGLSLASFNLLAPNSSSSSNISNNNNQAVQVSQPTQVTIKVEESSVFASAFMEAHKKSPDRTKEFTKMCLLPLYVKGQISDTYKKEAAYKLFVSQYESEMSNRDQPKFMVIESLIVEYCNQLPLFEHLVQKYFESYNTLGGEIPETLVTFSKEYLVPLYLAGRVPEDVKQEAVYQLLTKQYQAAEQRKDKIASELIRNMVIEYCNQPPLLEKLVKMYLQL